MSIIYIKNILKKASSFLDYKHSEESLILIGKAQKGKFLSAEAKALISKAQIGRTFSAETLAKFSLSRSGQNNPIVW